MTYCRYVIYVCDVGHDLAYFMDFLYIHLYWEIGDILATLWWTWFVNADLPSLGYVKWTSMWQVWAHCTYIQQSITTLLAGSCKTDQTDREVAACLTYVCLCSRSSTQQTISSFKYVRSFRELIACCWMQLRGMRLSKTAQGLVACWRESVCGTNHCCRCWQYV